MDLKIGQRWHYQWEKYNFILEIQSLPYSMEIIWADEWTTQAGYCKGKAQVYNPSKNSTYLKNQDKGK